MKLIDFLNASPVNFLAIDTVKKCLNNAGYRELDAADEMPLMKAGARFYVTKNASALFAFEIGSKPLAETGVHVIAAHSDSPTLRIKPNAEMYGEGGVVKLDTEVYGGAILSTWFDRPLSLAGRVVVRGKDALHPEELLLHIKRPLLQIPNLAIHFNRQVNDGYKINRQKDMLPILGIIKTELERDGLLCKIIADELGVNVQDIIDFELSVYDTTAACVVGVHDEFVSAGRLDDLSMVHAGMSALIQSLGSETTKVLAVFDNEETGSQTKQGAGSPILACLLERMVMAQGGTREDYLRMIERSFLVCADNAHAWHPNYGEKYDPKNHPVLGGGPVVKYNAAQKYITDASTAAVFAEICREAGVPFQKFVNHSDVAGGSTLGGILTASLPINGVDMGNPIWAMHSVREMGAMVDQEYCIKAFTKFYEA